MHPRSGRLCFLSIVGSSKVCGIVVGRFRHAGEKSGCTRSLIDGKLLTVAPGRFSCPVSHLATPHAVPALP